MSSCVPRIRQMASLAIADGSPFDMFYILSDIFLPVMYHVTGTIGHAEQR